MGDARWKRQRSGCTTGSSVLTPPVGLATVPDDADPLLDHRAEQIFLGGEMTVDGACADARPSSDLVDGHGKPLGGERLVGDLQQAGAIARRVGA